MDSNLIHYQNCFHHFLVSVGTKVSFFVVPASSVTPSSEHRLLPFQLYYFKNYFTWTTQLISPYVRSFPKSHVSGPLESNWPSFNVALFFSHALFYLILIFLLRGCHILQVVSQHEFLSGLFYLKLAPICFEIFILIFEWFHFELFISTSRAFLLSWNRLQVFDLFHPSFPWYFGPL